MFAEKTISDAFRTRWPTSTVDISNTTTFLNICFNVGWNLPTSRRSGRRNPLLPEEIFVIHRHGENYYAVGYQGLPPRGGMTVHRLEPLPVPDFSNQSGDALETAFKKTIKALGNHPSLAKDYEAARQIQARRDIKEEKEEETEPTPSPGKLFRHFQKSAPMTSEEVRDFYRIIIRLFSQTASSLDSRSLMRILRVVRVGEESELKTKEKRLLAALSEIHPTCRDHAWSKIWRNHRSTDLEQV